MSRCEGVLHASSNVGRYQIGEDGPDVTVGNVYEVRLAGRWVRGTVFHSKGRSDLGGMVAIEHPGGGVYESYYLEVEVASGLVTLCGLCTGMYVRLLW